MAKSKCLNPECDHMLFEAIPLDDAGTAAIKTGTNHPTVEYDLATGRPFMRCPACKAKNGFVQTSERAGAPARFVLDTILN